METKRRPGRPRKLQDNGQINNGDNKQDQQMANSSSNEVDVTLDLGQGFDPLQTDVVQRDYATPPIEAQAPVLEEPQFHQQSYQEIVENQNKSTGATQSDSSSMGQGPTASAPAPPPPINPAINELDDPEKKRASEQMADAILDTYETVTGFAGNLAKVKKEKVQQMMDEGKIIQGRTMLVEDQRVSMTDFIDAFNANIDEASKPDKQFRKNVKPPLTRILLKRGMAMTDEQYVLFAVVKDVSVRAGTLYAMRRSMNDILKALQNEAAERGYQAPPPPRQNYNPPPQPEAPPGAPAPNIPYPPVNPDEFDDTDFEPKEDDERVTVEEVDDDQLLYEQRMKAMRVREEAVTKHEIKFDDNPLRNTHIPEDYPEPKVEETFTRGQELKDDNNPA